jgi:MATE family multidrug resistance protein
MPAAGNVHDLNAYGEVRGGYRELIRVAIPLILSTASFTVMHFLDRLMLAHYSDTTAAAATSAGVLSFALLSFFMGIAGYTNTFIAQYYGAGDRKMCAVSLWQGIYFVLCAGVLFPIVFRPLGMAVLSWAGHEPDVLAAERIYFGILVVGSICPLMNSVLGSFFSGRGDTWTVMWVNVAAAVINVILNYCMIFGRCGFPEMGIAGAAIATISASFSSNVIYAGLISRRPWRRLYGVWRYAALRMSSFWQLLRFGGPSGISFGLDIMAFSFFILLIGKLGKPQLIASNFTVTINSLAFLPMLGLSIATSILVGQHIGESNRPAAEKSAYSGVKLAIAHMVFMGLIFIIFPQQLFGLFKSDRFPPELFVEVLTYGRYLLVMIAVLGIFDAVNVTFSGALKGAGDTLFPMWANVIIAWVLFIPPVYVVTVTLQASLYWAWLFFVVYVALLGLVFWWRFSRGAWKNIEIRETVAPVVLPEMAEEARIIES